ncbi:DUF4012 domain-containing protein [Dactylosporangium sp. NPDC051541]|uniref:DUF4012 domain-containing protein n=1 Tax=Dactylosporangium sp. NPDC051541 TaxID=3363977 RepID=UPI0037AA7FEC
MPGRTRTAHRRPSRLRRRLIPALVLVLVPLSALSWLGLRVSTVHDELVAAAALARQLPEELRHGDLAAARRTAEALRRRTHAAADGVRDPAWRAAALTSRSLAAVRETALGLETLARDAVPPLLETLAAGLDPGALAAAAPKLTAGDRAVRGVVDRLARIPADGLAPQVARPLDDLKVKLRTIAAATRAAAVLPGLLGADRPRTYLVLFQNLAEMRATGGMPGAYAVLGADRGRISLLGQGTATGGLGAFDAPVLPVEDGIRQLYGDDTAMHSANINLAPDFPGAAAVVREMYRRRTGTTVDGVLATDPVALAYLLAATGPVPVAGGETLTADNAVRLLLSDVYARLPHQEQQDAYFAGAARAVFEAVLAHPAPPRALLGALAQAVHERRILAWSADPAEQTRIAGTPLEGALPADDPGAPTAGVFLDEGGASKLGYYLTPSAGVVQEQCDKGFRGYSVQLALTSVAPGSGLPSGVLSWPTVVPDPYTLRTLVSVAAPTGWTVGGATVDGAKVSIVDGTVRGRMVALFTADVPPGATRTVTVRIVPPRPDAPAPELVTTPLARPWTINPVSPGKCAPPR